MYTRWNIAKARQNFSQLLQEAEQEPQSIYNRDQLVAAVVDAATYEAFQKWQNAQKRSIVKEIQTISTICQEEDYSLESPKRVDRMNPFA